MFTSYYFIPFLFIHSSLSANSANFLLFLLNNLYESEFLARSVEIEANWNNIVFFKSRIELHHLLWILIKMFLSRIQWQTFINIWNPIIFSLNKHSKCYYWNTASFLWQTLTVQAINKIKQDVLMTAKDIDHCIISCLQRP